VWLSKVSSSSKRCCPVFKILLKSNKKGQQLVCRWPRLLRWQCHCYSIQRLPFHSRSIAYPEQLI